jgi:hypothetical protein
LNLFELAAPDRETGGEGLQQSGRKVKVVVCYGSVKKWVVGWIFWLNCLKHRSQTPDRALIFF